jgi:hypothetical protein
MASSTEEIALALTLKTLECNPPGAFRRTDGKGTDANATGEHIGELYRAILRAVESSRSV